ncbi:MAG: class I SAM-dependent methyltransferase [Planctomycetes bacterium]|nr:class I SAM-dependent methyltransferase [Planctomycetota bacterium]
MAHETAKPWSNRSTGAAVLRELAALDWTHARVADVGAGRGGFSKLLFEDLERRRGVDPAAVILPCDLVPASFEYPRLSCAAIRPDGSLPYADGAVDAAVSMEVIEHVEDQFRFLRELVRITRPGGLVIVTTPNTHHLPSRLRALSTGFPVLYDPLPLARHDPRRLGGHIHPIAPYFLLYAAHRAGLSDLRLVHDRHKTSARLLALPLWPWIRASTWAHRARLRRKHPDVLAENEPWLRRIDSLDMLTSRTAIIVGRRPVRDAEGAA